MITKPKIPKLSQLTLENFGVYYLKTLQKESRKASPPLSDKELVAQVRWLTARGIILSALIGAASAFVSVATDLYYENSNPWLHYGMLALNTLLATGVEFYFLFVIALRTVDAIANLTETKYTNEFTEDGPFNIINILARAAMEIPDPPIKVLDIDPFKEISKSRMVIAGFIYKMKIFLSNILMRVILQRLAGKSTVRYAKPWVSLPITGIWNAFILYKVSREARLRIFGNILASNIAKNMINDTLLTRLSPIARIGCLRAIANAVVLTQNYHPNMIILLMRFKDLLGIEEPDNFDDWQLFLDTLDKVNEEERYTILDILTIAAAFDGKISRLERKHLKEAYKEYSDIYFARLEKLTHMLTRGNLQEAIKLCEIDGKPG